MTRALAAAAAAAAVALLAFGGARTDSGADVAPAPPAAHPPVAAGGPDGRMALDGDWVERSDRAGRGAALGWYRGTFDGRTVHVPFSPNAATVRGAAGLRSFMGSVAWYRTSFEVPAAGDYALR